MDEHPHRRDFVRTLVLGASAGALSRPGASRGDEPEDEKLKDDRPRPEPPKSEADARMELVLTRFGERLDPQARKAIRDEVGSIVRRAEELRKFPLTNGDGPLPIFTPYRAPLA